MTFERAIEILDPDRAERFDDYEPVFEACRMAMKALKFQQEAMSAGKAPEEKEDSYQADGSEVEERPWIIDCMDVVCPYCSTRFDDEISYMIKDTEKWGLPKHCPECGKRLKQEAEGG